MPISNEQLEERLEWLRLSQNGASFTDIAAKAGVHRTTVMRSVRVLEGMADGPKQDDFYKNNHHLEEWQEALEWLNGQNRYLTGIIEADHHFVDHDPTSILLTRQIQRSVQPDFTIYNGDTMDFAAVAKFLMARREPRKDVLRAPAPFWRNWVEDHLDVNRNMIQIHNSGNHNARLDSFLAMTWQVEETVEDAYRDLIRQDGAVVMHDFLEEVVIGDLLIKHGERTNIHADKSQVEDIAFGMGVATGHKHVPKVYYRRQPRGWRKIDRVVTSVIGGCLCRLVPRYAEHKTNISQWINGIIQVHVHPLTGDFHLTPINYHPLEDGLVGVVGSDVFTQRYVDPEMVEWW